MKQIAPLIKYSKPNYSILPSHIDIHAKVTDQMGLPIIAHVWIKENKDQNAAADFDTGSFTLSNVDLNHTLVVSYQAIEIEIPIRQVGQVIAFPTEQLNEVDLGTVSAKKTNWLGWILGAVITGTVIYQVTKEQPVKVSL